MSEAAMSHRHWFTALWWNFGEHGDQRVHVHSCLHEDADGEFDCQRVIIGEGRDCPGRDGRHWRRTLTEDGPVPGAVIGYQAGGRMYHPSDVVIVRHD